MREGAPGAKLKDAPGKFRNEESAARYFRKIKTGERSGGAMYRAGEEPKFKGLFQVRLRYGEGDRDFVSQNITVAQGDSTFDIPAVEHQLRTTRRDDLRQTVNYYRNRYGAAEYAFDPDEDMEVRTIRMQRRPIRMRLAL